VRIPARLYQPSASLRRVIAINGDLTWRQALSEPTQELFALFSAYQKARHSDSDMALMTYVEFAAMILDGHCEMQLFELRSHDGRLQGVMLADTVAEGLSAVYSFFDTEEPKRSLGSYLVLSLVEEVLRQNLLYVYLGYWVAGSKKMAYKSRFKPMQRLSANGWDWLE
jgi:arginine-tRNA-protein transferase